MIVFLAPDEELFATATAALSEAHPDIRIEQGLLSAGVRRARELARSGTEIIISEYTRGQLPDDLIARELDDVRVKGKYEPVKIYEVLGALDQISPELDAARRCFQAGLRLYKERRWDDAIREFQQALQTLPNDAPSQLYITRCQQYRVTPPPENWDGVFEMKTK